MPALSGQCFLSNDSVEVFPLINVTTTALIIGGVTIPISPEQYRALRMQAHDRPDRAIHSAQSAGAPESSQSDEAAP